MDDSILDPDFLISDDSSSSEGSTISDCKDKNATSSHCKSFNVSVALSENFAPDDRELSVEVSKGLKSQRKYNINCTTFGRGAQK